MGKGGGGGGSINVPKPEVPNLVGENAKQATGLASYAQNSIFPQLQSISNWALDIATGGNVWQNNAPEGTQQFYPFVGGTWSPTDPWAPQSQAQGAPGFSGTPGAPAAQQAISAATGGAGAGGGLELDPGISLTGTGPYVSALIAGGSGSANYVPVGNGYYQLIDQTGINYPYYQLIDSPGEGGGKMAVQAQAPLQQTPATQDAAAPGPGASHGGGGGAGMLGPFYGTAWNALNQIPGIEAETAGFTKNADAWANQLYQEGQGLYSMATTGTGLTPSQQAFVTQATQGEQANIANTLAVEGLGTSSANAVLQGEAAQQGAATAGQLVQGNINIAQQQIQLAQAAQKISLGGQELTLGEQAAMEQEAQSLQAQSFGQAMAGEGLLGQMIQTALQGLDISDKGLEQYTQASIAYTQAETQAHIAQSQIDAQSQQSSGSGLGSLIGSLGSLFGGIGGLVGGGGAAAGGSGLIGALGGIIGGLAAF